MFEVPTTPVLVVDGSRESQREISHAPYTVGRQPGSDILLEDAFVSRKHAEIVYENGSFYIVDQGSKHGTYLNGAPVKRHKLSNNDAVHFGKPDGPFIRFGVRSAQSSSTLRELLGPLKAESSTSNTAIEKLSWLLEANRKLNNEGAVDQILTALVETTLTLTKVERGYVMLRDPASGALKLIVGLDSKGKLLNDDSTISHSAIKQALQGTGEFIVTDTLSAETGVRSESVIAQNIRTVICIPLRSRRNVAGSGRGEVLGVLYLDSRLTPGHLTKVDNDLLKTIASEAAALVDNAQLAIAEENSRRVQEELEIARRIQQSLMPREIPDLPYAKISTLFVPCKEVGGDFYDVLAAGDHLHVVIADVSGKGVAAAMLAQTLQGMVYAQMLADQPLAVIAKTLNRFICTKDVGKYATMIILRLDRDGHLEYINCGQVHPLMRTATEIVRLTESNFPVGLLEEGVFKSYTATMEPGMRLLVVTDGVTEAEDVEGDFFGTQRMEDSFSKSKNLDEVVEDLSTFCGPAAANDDCTIVEIEFRQAVG
jgi:sigma-B regulation protein RsbU (phosphoserine phosphatase)